MATSTVFLYRVKFNRDLNPYIDDIGSYLTTCPKQQISDFQYIRHDLEIEIKLDLDQDVLSTFNYNYCTIKNNNEVVDNNIFYYYINKTTQISEKTILLNLSLDTINTLGKTDELCNPRNFTSETEIAREHEDRFKKPTSWNPSVGGTLYRSIDEESEGIVPDKNKFYQTKLLSPENDDYNWYLIYKNEHEVDPEEPSATNPVNIFLCADHSINVGVESRGSSVTYTPSNFETGTYYYFLDIDNSNGTFSTGSWNVTLGTNINKCVAYNDLSYGFRISQVEPRKVRGLVIHKNSASTMRFTLIYNDDFFSANQFSSIHGSPIVDVVGNLLGTSTSKWITISSITFTQANIFRTSTTDYVAANQQPEGIKSLVDSEFGIYVGTQTRQTLSTIDDINRTDSKLIKIIKYPYCPVWYYKSGTTYDFGEDWVYNLGLMKYNDSNLPILGQNCTSITVPELRYSLSGGVVGYTNPKNIGRESKLYHSDFYSYKLVYDSFAKDYKLENFKITNPVYSEAQIFFKPTGTINSKLGFKPNFNSQTIGEYVEDGDFDNLLLATRNNEETILNNEYINYIKTGYNYDKKANALQIEQAKRNAGVSSVASIGSIIAGVIDVAVGSKVLGAGMITGGIAGLATNANQWANVSKTQQAQDNAMQSKLAQLAAQSTSTSGTDDIDLMSWYSDNKLWLMKYEPKSYMKTKIWKALDNTGYAHSDINVPEVDSRIWYNYIQCTPHIDDEGIKKYKQVWLDDLKQKYQNGVTVFHHNIVSGTVTYDFDRQYENWETWIVEGV